MVADRRWSGMSLRRIFGIFSALLAAAASTLVLAGTALLLTERCHGDIDMSR
jgi:hypothetical protein